MKQTILCIDDETDNVEALERLFRKKYHVLKATSGDEGLEILNSQPDIAVMISDQRMPQMTGVEFFEKSQRTHPDSIRILLTGYTDVESVIAAINEGRIYRYVTKPWDPIDFVNAVDKAVERYLIGQELRQKNASLEQALEELRTLDEAKNHFMILINHELKTPLTTVISYLELLRESEPSTEQKKFIERMQQGTDRLHRLISDALDLISAETGVLKVSFKKTSPAQIAEGLEAEFAEKLAAKKQRLTLTLEAVRLKADARLLRSVLARLLDNAIKFGDSGSSVEVHCRAHENGHVEFRVCNRGKAISPHLVQRILKPFSLDEDIMHHAQGSGLGLSLAQAFLRTHESALQFQSTKGHVEVFFLIPPTL